MDARDFIIALSPSRKTAAVEFLKKANLGEMAERAMIREQKVSGTLGMQMGPAAITPATPSSLPFRNAQMAARARTAAKAPMAPMTTSLTGAGVAPPGNAAAPKAPTPPAAPGKR